MKTPRLARFALSLCLLWLTLPTAWAHLPHPIETKGAAVAIDHDTQTLVFKEGRGKKPVVLDWNKDTQFIKDGQQAALSALTNGTSVVISYKNVSFRNPLLKKIQWSSNATAGQETRNLDKKD